MNLIYSDKFKRALKKMPENNIAIKLIEIENKNLDISSNYFDIKNDNDSVITFTPENKVKEFLQKKSEFVTYQGGGAGGCLTNNIISNKDIFEKLGYSPKSKEIYHPQNNESGEIISKVVSEKTGKTWCFVKFEGGEGVYNFNKLKNSDFDINKLIFNKNRQEVRTGRAIRLILQSNQTSVSDSEIEKFVNDLKATIKIMNDIFSNFEIVDGEQLLYWYHRDRYVDPNRGTLGSSCQAVGRKDWLEIYITNPDTVKLVILKSPDDFTKIIGRVLLWNLEDGRKVIDYIYTNKDSDEKIFKDYAKHNNWCVMNSDYNAVYVAHLKPGTYEKYPSVDSMYYWDPTTGKLSNKHFTGCKRIEWTQD